MIRSYLTTVGQLAKNHRCPLLLYALMICGITGAWAQSPWTPEKGGGYMQLSMTTIPEYNTLFAGEGEEFTTNRNLSDITVQYYLEYGLTDKDALMFNLPLKLMSSGELAENPTLPIVLVGEGDFSSLGNIGLGYKRNIIEKNYLLSAQLMIELPTSSFDATTGLSSGLDALSVIPRINVGKSYESFYFYGSLGAAIRNNDYSHGLLVNAEIGFEPLPKLNAALVLDILSSFENGNPVIDARQLQTGFYVNDQEYVAFGLKFSYGLTEQVGLNLGLYGAGAGNLVAASPSINFGAYFKW